MMAPIPDLVKDSELQTQFFPEYTRHVYFVSCLTPGQRRVRREEKEERWMREKSLGKGSFGTVWLERCLTDEGKGRVRAVKEIQKLPKYLKVTDYSRELEAIAKFSHARYDGCFVKSFGWYESAEFVFIAMEYIQHGDLQRFLTKPLPEIEAQLITSQVLEGLALMHENGFAHRDLKPANILVVSESPDWWVKIGDFGISKRAEEGLTALRTISGTPGFLAPELLGFIGSEDDSDLSHTVAVDIWALGEITFRILTGETPFKNLNTLRTYVQGRSNFPSASLFENGVSREGYHFVERLMVANPEVRSTAKDALQLNWLKAQPQPSEPGSPESFQHKPKAEELSFTNQGRSKRHTTAAISPQNKTSTTAKSTSNASGKWSTLESSKSSGRWNIPDESERVKFDCSPTSETMNNPHATQLRIQKQGLWKGTEEPLDDQLVASTSDESTAKLWGNATGSVYRTLEGHSDDVNAVAFSPDGRLIASGSDDKTIIIWDLTTGVVHYKLEGHKRPVVDVSFSPDGKVLASASVDTTVRTWDPAKGESRYILTGHTHTSFSVAFSPDGKQLASASGDGTIGIWDATTGELRHKIIDNYSYYVFRVTFSPDGKLLASASTDGKLTIWSSATGKMRCQLKGHTSAVFGVRFSPDGQIIASISDDLTVRLWDPITGVERCKLVRRCDPTYRANIIFSPDGMLLATTLSNKPGSIVRVWDSTTGAMLCDLTSDLYSINGIAFSPDGKLIASASSDQTVKLWHPKKAAE